MIYLLLLPVIFYMCSGVLDAVMDTLKDHYSISIFANENAKYWNPAISWKNKYVDFDPAKGFIKWNVLGLEINKPVIFTDAWHLAKFFREGYNKLAIISVLFIAIQINIAIVAIFLLMLSITRNIAFDVFYNDILIKK